MRLPITLLAAMLGAALPAGAASAADLDYGFGSAPPPVVALPESKVEFGSGWYVRGDIGATRLPSMDLTDPTAVGQAPTIAVTSGSAIGYTASLGAGYSFNKFFRSDIIVDFHEPINLRRYAGYFPASPSTADSVTGYVNNKGTCQIGYAPYTNNSASGITAYQPYYENCSSTNQAALSSYDVLVNGYIDLGHWWALTPYIGGGIGVAFGHYSASTNFYNPDGTSYNTTFALVGTGTTVHGYNDVRVSGTYYNFAFAATAGVAIDIYAHTKLDINYRYLHLGEVLGANVATNEARIGLRYMIDN